MGTITIKNLIGGSINIITNSKPENPLCFTAQEENAKVRMIGPFNWQTNSNNVTASLQISKDGQKNWTAWNGSEINLNSECENGKLYVKALNPNTNGFYDALLTSNHQFVINNGKVAASGSIQYLIDPTGERTDVPDYCYQYMFDGCTSLTTAPELPATTMANYCYQNMFRNCTSLTSAPELPATTLANYCYYDMFYKCPLFSSVKMKASMNGVYNTSTHGDIKKNVEYVL